MSLRVLNIKDMETIDGKKVYKCSFCNKLSLNKGAMVIHERCCKKNPSNWTPCASCVHLKKVETKVDGTEGNRCKFCCHCVVDRETGYRDCTKDTECDGSLFATDFVCEVTGKKMYYARKVLMMTKKKAKDAILSRCDCAMPSGDCEHFKGVDMDFMDEM